MCTVAQRDTMNEYLVELYSHVSFFTLCVLRCTFGKRQRYVLPPRERLCRRLVVLASGTSSLSLATTVFGAEQVVSRVRRGSKDLCLYSKLRCTVTYLAKHTAAS